jgi:phospholipid/cholesterol/gamma-HCH transport system substrate-binding protein
MRRADPRVGIALFLGGTALVLLALVALARYPALFNRGREFHTVFHNVSGLNLGDEVRFGGLLVGTVTAMELDEPNPTQIVVRFRVRRSTPIRVDTRATITQVGLLGEPYLDLQPGRYDADPLPAGSAVLSQESLSFQAAMTRLAHFLDRIDTLMTGAERLASTSPFDRLDRTLARMEGFVGTASEGSERIFAQLDLASRELTEVLDRTERMLTTIDTTFRGAGPELQAAQREAMATIRESRALVADVRDAMQAGGGLDNMVRNIATASENLARLSARIERDPTSVLRSREPPKKVAGPKVHD